MPLTSASHPSLAVGAVVGALEADGYSVGSPATAAHRVLDTFDGRLHAAGVRLELIEARTGSAAELVLSGPDPGAPAARLSWSGPAPAWPAAELPPGPFRQRLTAITQERALVTLFAVTTRARSARRTDKRDKGVAHVEVHEAIDLPGAPPWVATVVPVAGHAPAAERAERLLADVGATLEPDGAVAAIARATGASLAGTTTSPTIPLLATDGALAAHRAVLANLVATVDVNLDGTVEDIDSEFLHELRVAVRRTRSVLGQAKGVVPDDVRSRFADGFKWLGQVTTDPRDLDVYILGWDDYVAPLPTADAALLEPVRAELDARRVAAHQELSTTLRGERATRLLADWRVWLHDGGVGSAAPGVPAESAESADQEPIGPVVARRIRKLQRGVLRDGREIHDESPGERLHDLRKDAKKLRYMLECFGSLLAAKPRKQFVAQLKALQDNLGEHQDAEVHVDQLRALARDLHRLDGIGPDELLAMGRLSDHLDRRRQAARDEFAERFAAYDTKANRRALDHLLAPLRHPAASS